MLNIYSESITTHGLYLALVGEECFKAIDAESLSMNAVPSPLAHPQTHTAPVALEKSSDLTALVQQTEEKSALVEIYVPLSGNTEWSERKKNKHMFFRGTYHYPFRVPIPRKTIAGTPAPRGKTAVKTSQTCADFP